MADPTSQGTPIPVKTGSTLNPTWSGATDVTPPPVQVNGATSQVATDPNRGTNVPPFQTQPASAAELAPVVSPPSSLPPVSAAMPDSPQDTNSVPVVAALPSPSQVSASSLTTSVPVLTPQVGDALPKPELSTSPTPAPLAPPPAELSVTPPPRKLVRLPWKPILIAGGLLLVIGGVIGYLWWEGIGIGLPRDPKLALGKMLTALSATESYALSGDVTLDISTAGLMTDAQEQSKQIQLASTLLATEVSPSASAPDESTTKCPSGDGTTRCGDDSVESIASDAVTHRGAIALGLSFAGQRADALTSTTTIRLDLSQIPTTILPNSLPDALELEVRRVGQDVYLRSPLLAAIMADDRHPWFIFANTNTQSTFLNHPKEVDVAGLYKSGSRIGYEQIGPVKVGHYRAQLDLVSFIKLLRPDLGDQAWLSQLSDTSIQADFWLGTKDHLPYKVLLQVAGGPTASALVTIKTTLNFAQYGSSFAIAPPDPNEVTAQPLTRFDWTDLEGSLQKTARDSQRKADLRQLKAALERYFFDHKEYPKTETAGIRTSTPKSPLEVLLAKGYLKTLPTDIQEPIRWYGYTSDGTQYELSAALENLEDPDGKARGTIVLLILTSDLPPVATPGASATTNESNETTSGLTPSTTATTGRLPTGL